MRYRDLKDERDAAVARALEAERLSMKSEFDRVTAEFAQAKAELLARAVEEAKEAFRRGFLAGSNAMAEEYAKNLAKVCFPPMTPGVVGTPPDGFAEELKYAERDVAAAPAYKRVTMDRAKLVDRYRCAHLIWEKDDQGVECCVFCGVTAERKREPS